MKAKTTVMALAPVLYLAFAVAHAAPVSVSAVLCGGGPAEKDLLTLKKGQVFDLTDVTIGNTSSSGRVVGVVQGAWPPPGVVDSQLSALVAPGSTFTQQFKTPIAYRAGGPVKGKTVCGKDNLAVYVTVSGDLH